MATDSAKEKKLRSIMAEVHRDIRSLTYETWDEAHTSFIYFPVDLYKYGVCMRHSMCHQCGDFLSCDVETRICNCMYAYYLNRDGEYDFYQHINLMDINRYLMYAVERRQLLKETQALKA